MDSGIKLIKSFLWDGHTPVQITVQDKWATIVIGGTAINFEKDLIFDLAEVLDLAAGRLDSLERGDVSSLAEVDEAIYDREREIAEGHCGDVIETEEDEPNA